MKAHPKDATKDKVTIYTHLSLDEEYNLIAQQPLHSFNVKNFVMTPTVSVALGPGDDALRIIGKFVPSTSCKMRPGQTLESSTSRVPWCPGQGYPAQEC